MLKVTNTRSLEAVLKLCQKYGVRQIEFDGIKMQLEASDTAQATPSTVKPELANPLENMSEEDLLFYSSQGAN